MINFHLSIPVTQAPEPESPAAPAPEVTVESSSTITAEPVAKGRATHLLRPAKDWTPENLRDYVLAEAEARFGPQPSLGVRELGIMRSFMERHGALEAVMVAQAAFEVYGGLWRQAPVGIGRFTKGNDPYFADVILARVKG